MLTHLRSFLSAPGGWLLALLFAWCVVAVCSVAWASVTGWLAERCAWYGRLTGGK
tara:strand:- start:75 stop:239 length:165 start_codon:yes stop_codon:yes gene_type:complete